MSHLQKGKSLYAEMKKYASLLVLDTIRRRRLVFSDDYEFSCEKNDLRRRMVGVVEAIESSPAKTVDISLKARAYEPRDIKLWQWIAQMISVSAAILAFVSFVLRLLGVLP